MSKRGGHSGARGGADSNYKYQQKGGASQGRGAGGGGAQGEGQGAKQGGAKYVPKGSAGTGYSAQGGNQGGMGGEGQNQYQNKNQYQQKGQGQNKNYTNYKQGGNKGYQKGPGQYQNNQNWKGGQGGQADPMMQQQFFPHQQNLQQMDQSELQDLLLNTLSFYAKDIAQTSGTGGQSNIQNLLNTLKKQGGLGGGPQGGGNQGYGRGGGRGGFQGGGRGRGGGNQMMGGGMSMPPPNSGDLSNMFSGQGLPQGFQMPSADPNAPATKAGGSGEETKQEGGAGPQTMADLQEQAVMQQQQAMLNTNICEKHFPEPIIYMSEKPLCKKCIPEYLQNQKKKQVTKKGKDEGKNKDEQKMAVASMLGLTSFSHQNLYKGEKSIIGKCLLRMDDFKGEFRYLQDEIEERAQESMENLENLPELMCQIFDQSEKVIISNKAVFVHQIDTVINKQRDSFKKDNETKVPNFYERLSQKYSQLQQATTHADQIKKEQLIGILTQYKQLFMDLDSEFEKYFNEFESVSKLQRLLDKDPNEVIKDFTNLIETNLRVDYNIKNSFQPGVPSRVHSFQWNQKYAYILKVHNSEFEKRPVQMEFEVPLYSRSIATEDGGIYLIGGCNKRRNQYLKSCYRYNEIFATLDEKSQMIYPHADHSLCSVEGYIYVVGTFVNSQVYGFCEVYDIQKDQWKQIDSLRIARSGVALSAFKNNFIYAFGGRIDQKNIVDSIECYDISKNVWQEITTKGQNQNITSIDKSFWVPGYMSLAYQITDNEIMIFGGKSAITQQIFNGCFVFDVEKMEIQERGKLVNPCSFMNTPLVFGGNMFAFGNDIYIHKYSIAEQKWSCIPKAFP